MKSMCHEARRNSPSVADCRPTSSCLRTTSRIASSSAARSVAASISPRANSSRASSSCAGRSRLPTWSARNGGFVRSMRPQGYGIIDGRLVIEREGASMSDSVYRVTEVIGVSSESWEAAARNAVETAARTVRDLRVAEATRFDVTIEDGQVATYRVRLDISFKYEGT